MTYDLVGVDDASQVIELVKKPVSQDDATSESSGLGTSSVATATPPPKPSRLAAPTEEKDKAAEPVYSEVLDVHA